LCRQAADPGDQVVFHFYPKNHSVAQSSFASPCDLKSGGFDSGLYVPFHFRIPALHLTLPTRFSMAVAANATTFPTFTVPVENVCQDSLVVQPITLIYFTRGMPSGSIADKPATPRTLTAARAWSLRSTVV
jgi:hypothetical protein